MAVRNKILTWHLKSGEALDDLTSGTGVLWKPIDSDGTISNNGQDAIGILQYGGGDDEHVSVAVSGISKFTAGASIIAGVQVTVTTSGYVTTAASGDHICGRNLDMSVSSGAVGTGLFDFNKSSYFESTSAHIATYEQYGFTAQADLSAAASANLIVNVQSGDFAADGNDSGGVLVTGTTSGGTSYVRFDGAIPVKAGGVITSGQSITSAASGWTVSANSGDVILGRALDASAAGNSGSTFTAMFNLATPHYATSCLDVQY